MAMTKEQMDEVRARCEAGRSMRHDMRRNDQEFIQRLYEDIHVLLDAVEEAQAIANRHVCAYCSQVFEGGTSADTLREHIDVCPLHPIADVRAERDHYKARAEAAERRAGALERVIVGDCLYCDRIACKMPCGCINGNAWKLDQARFEEG